MPIAIPEDFKACLEAQRRAIWPGRPQRREPRRRSDIAWPHDRGQQGRDRRGDQRGFWQSPEFETLFAEVFVALSAIKATETAHPRLGQATRAHCRSPGFPGRAQPRDPATARRRRRHRALEFSAAAELHAAGVDFRGGQSRDGQDVRAFAPADRTPDESLAEIFSAESCASSTTTARSDPRFPRCRSIICCSPARRMSGAR